MWQKKSVAEKAQGGEPVGSVVSPLSLGTPHRGSSGCSGLAFHLRPPARATSIITASASRAQPDSAATSQPTSIKMLSRAAARVSQKTTSTVARRGFQTSRAQLSSPYHYPEGPYTNIPFNPKSKYFPVGFWSFCIVGFSAPFLIATWQTYKPKA